MMSLGAGVAEMRKQKETRLQSLCTWPCMQLLRSGATCELIKSIVTNEAVIRMARSLDDVQRYGSNYSISLIYTVLFLKVSIIPPATCFLIHHEVFHTAFLKGTAGNGKVLPYTKLTPSPLSPPLFAVNNRIRQERTLLLFISSISSSSENDSISPVG